MSKERTTITMDGELLSRVDRVAAIREESRSAVIERMVINGIGEEESFLCDMENPVTRTMLQILGSSPRLVHTIAKALGNELTKDEAGAMHKAIQEQAGLGRERAGRRRKREGGLAGKGA